MATRKSVKVPNLNIGGEGDGILKRDPSKTGQSNSRAKGTTSDWRNGDANKNTEAGDAKKSLD